MPRASDGLLAIYVRPPGSPDLAQRLCSAASSLRCRTAAEDGSVAELERSRGHGNLLLTTLTAPATVPSGAFYFVSLTNPLEALSASPPRRNPQCAALLPPGETASLAACTRLWTELSRRCDWVGDLHDARAHRALVTALVERGGEAWRHVRPPATAPFELARLEPERFTATTLELEPLRERHEADFALYRWARKEHATCARGGHYVRGEDDTPPYTRIGRSHRTVKRLAPRWCPSLVAAPAPDLDPDGSGRLAALPEDVDGPHGAPSRSAFLGARASQLALVAVPTMQATPSRRRRTPLASDTGTQARRQTRARRCGRLGRTTRGYLTTAHRCTRRTTGAPRSAGSASSSSGTPSSTRRSSPSWACCTLPSGRPLRTTSS